MESNENNQIVNQAETLLPTEWGELILSAFADKDGDPMPHLSLRHPDMDATDAVIYLRQEGRGIGIINKIKAYRHQEQGLDTIEANEVLGFEADYRNYTIAADILKSFDISKIKLLTNNPDKINKLDNSGIEVVDRIPLEIEPNHVNRSYLKTKADSMGHILNLK